MARIPYPEPAELQPATQEALAKIRGINVFRMMAWAEGVAPPMFDFVKEVFASLELDARSRQLAIVCVGHLCESAYELHQHEKIARKVGLTEADLDCAAGRAPIASLSPRDQAVLRFATEMTQDVRVSDATFAQARAVFSHRELTELAIVTSFYSCICRFLETMQIEIEPPKAPSAASSRADGPSSHR
jgi:4-carboxymuconolactone decarboxylase